MSAGRRKLLTGMAAVALSDVRNAAARVVSASPESLFCAA